MFKRLFAIFILLFLPAVALADDPAPDATPTATDTPAATSTPAPSSPGYSLGPSSTGAAAGGSTDDSLKLQSAGISPLQSTTSDSDGLTAPNSNVLQAPADPNLALKVLAGEADGAPVQVADSGSHTIWGWLGITALLALIVAAAILALRRYPKLARPIRKIVRL